MVEIKDISFSYNRSAKKILNEISFDIQQNQCIAILGNNGAGKSTLLKCIDNILPTKKGLVLVNGQNIFSMSTNKLAQNIAYVLQKEELANLTVFDSIMLGRKPYIKWDTTDKDREIVIDIMQKMNLEAFALYNVTELSGGESQKVMLARALAQEPKFLLLDEPTSNLDLRNQHEVLQVVKNIAQEHNICVAIIIHDLNLALRYCDKFLFLKDAKVFSYGGAETVTTQTIEEVYNTHVHIIDYLGTQIVVPFPKAE